MFRCAKNKSAPLSDQSQAQPFLAPPSIPRELHKVWEEKQNCQNCTVWQGSYKSPFLTEPKRQQKICQSIAEHRGLRKGGGEKEMRFGKKTNLEHSNMKWGTLEGKKLMLIESQNHLHWKRPLRYMAS